MTTLSKAQGTPLQNRMIDDMSLGGLAERTQQNYVQAVRRLAARYWKSPEQITQEEVRAYILELRDQGAARGTFKTAYHGIKFLYTRTLGVKWELFEKRFGSRTRSGFLKSFLTNKSGNFSAM